MLTFNACNYFNGFGLLYNLAGLSIQNLYDCIGIYSFFNLKICCIYED